jgi:hypothetical protein
MHQLLPRRRAARALVGALAALTAACGMQSAPDHTLLRETGPAAPPTTLLAEAEPVAEVLPTEAAAPVEVPPAAAAPAEPAPAPPAPAAQVRAARGAPVVSSVVGSLEPYRGLGTWVDVYDWSHYKNSTASVGPADVDRMAEVGVQTLYIQTTKHDAPGDILEPELLLPIIQRARDRGIKVVAWYLPTLEDVGRDLQRLLASAALDVDGIAVDIEARNVGDVNERNRRLVELSAALRKALPGRAIGAIVLPPVLLEVVNPRYWPNFPYRELAPFYDIWMTMGYWTDRSASSGHRDARKYTSENTVRLRHNLGNLDVPIHPIGGIGDKTTDADIEGYKAALAEHGALGGSLYDWRTTRGEHWPRLQQLRI